MIRLKRTGRKNQPSYRVVVSPRGLGGPRAKTVEYLGWVNTLKKTFELKKERIQYWLSQGAKPSPTLHNLLVKTGLIQGGKIAVHQTPPPKEQLATESKPVVAPEAAPEPAAQPETPVSAVAEPEAPQEAPADNPQA